MSAFDLPPDDFIAMLVRYPISTPPHLVEAMLALAEVKEGDVVYDLGSGDGRIVIAAAQDFGASGVGVEINPELVTLAEENAAKAGVADRVRFVRQDFFQVDLHEATVVTLFLLSAVNLKLRGKLLSELRPGARIVSNTFDMGDWRHDKETSVRGVRLLLWIVPEARTDDTLS